MYLPNVAGTLSDSDKLEWSGAAQKQSQLKELEAVTDDLPDLSNWTEVDSGANVNLAAGVVSMIGNGSWAQNGISWTGGQARAEMVFEIKVFTEASLVSGGALAISNASGLPNGVPAGTIVLIFGAGNGLALFVHGSALSTVIPYTINTWYTVRFRVGKSGDGSTWRRCKLTIQGGSDYASETTLWEFDWIAYLQNDPIYFSAQRNNANAALFKVKEYRVYSLYDTGGEYSEYAHDAGVGATFSNFDPTNLAMPGSVPSTNLKFAWSHDDGTPSYSAWLTLVQLKAVGEQTDNKRYIRLRVQHNSDGSTQAYGAKPDANDATDGTGSSPAAPSEPVLAGSVISDTEIDLEWADSTEATYWKVKRKIVGGSYSYIGGDGSNKHYVTSYSDTGLTADTSYVYQVEVYGGGGSASSNENTISTLVTTDVPSSTAFGDLLDTVVSQVLAITDGGSLVYTASRVIVGDAGDIGALAEDAGNFPFVELSFDAARGEGYVSQRLIRKEIMFRMFVHTYQENEDRATGEDIKTLARHCMAVKNQMFGLLTLQQGGTDPCSGYLLTNPSFEQDMFYQLWSKQVNTGVLDISFVIQGKDIQIV